MRKIVRLSLLAGLFAVAASVAGSQARVHALSGKVTAVYPKISMIEVDTDDGSPGHFKWVQKSDGPIEFDKSVSADAVAAEKFATNGAHVIVYYIGEGDMRTVVAVRDLGTTPVEKNSGRVVKFNRRDRVLTIKNNSGAEQTYRVEPKTVADTTTGVAQNFKFDFNKGQEVRVTSLPAADNATALLIAPVM